MPDAEELLEEESGTETEETPAEVATDFLTEINGQKIYRIRILHSNVTELGICQPGMTVKMGDKVIVPTRYGKELGCIQGSVRRVKADPADVQMIERLASTQDLEKHQADLDRDRKAFELCQQKIVEHKLDMKLVNAHYLLEEPKLLFYFTAENRVDFRELVKDLVSLFKIRIELRQIGVRDEARVLGGLGVCGRDYCCHGITDKLKPVSIKMAKEQCLTLNSVKISGPCGRLLCCLAYEYETYRDVKKELPSEGARLNCEDETFRVLEINLFKRQVRLQGESGRILDVEFERFMRDPEKGSWLIQPASPPV